MKTILKIVFGAVVVLVGGAIYLLRPPSMSYISEFAPLKFPHGMKMIRSQDTGEYIVAEFMIPNEIKDKFYKSNELVIRKTEKRVFSERCRDLHRVETEETAENEMKIVITYPDPAGQGPCR